MGQNFTKELDEKNVKNISSKVNNKPEQSKTYNSNDFWSSMEMLASNRRAMINYRYN